MGCHLLNDSRTSHLKEGEMDKVNRETAKRLLLRVIQQEIQLVSTRQVRLYLYTTKNPTLKE